MSGGVAQLAGASETVAGITQLGYLPYFVALVGVWKVLGGGVVLLPGLPLVKEWAYAGMLCGLTGASVSHAAVGNDARHVLVPLALAAVVAASWALRPPGRTLRGAAAAA